MSSSRECAEEMGRDKISKPGSSSSASPLTRIFKECDGESANCDESTVRIQSINNIITDIILRERYLEDGNLSQDSPHESDDDLISEPTMFPRCEYTYRFKGTSAFKMADKKCWSTYYRSLIRDRVSQKYKKHYENININKNPFTGAKKMPAVWDGASKSLWCFNEYKELLDPKAETESQICDQNSEPLLYDLLLEYKVYICNLVVSKFQELANSLDLKINVYSQNSYPCVIVQVKNLRKLLQISKTVKLGSVYKIIIAYFIAVANKEALDANVPVEIVNRAGFGHNLPTIVEMERSFRINVGIVPHAYAMVLAKSLSTLNSEFLAPLLNKENKFKLNECVTVYDSGISSYKMCKSKKNKNTKKRNSIQHLIRTRKVKEVGSITVWKHTNDLLDVLCYQRDSSGQSVALQINRLREYLDLLTNYACHELMKNGDFAEPLRRILRALDYKKGVATLNVPDQDYYPLLYTFNDEEDKDIKNDQKFWNVVESILSAFSKRGINKCENFVRKRKIAGLYRSLEISNLMLIKQCAHQKSENLHGSDSECEITMMGGAEDGLSKFYSKKIITSTGMRATSLAYFLSTYYARPSHIDTKLVYYEVADLLKNKGSVCDISHVNRSIHNTPCRLLFLDLNHCAATSPTARVDLKKISRTCDQENLKVVILDYTSATSELISNAIRLFIKKAPVLFLVNSGMKNEQVGADMNPYGTLRIITKSKNELHKLYLTLTASLKDLEKQPKEAHQIRKEYKDIGAVMTNRAIYTEPRGYYYKPITDDMKEKLKYSNENLKANELTGELQKIFEVFTHCDDELANLNTYGKDINGIIFWELDKIRFLGSSAVNCVLNTFWSKGKHKEVFSQMESCYDNDIDFFKEFVDDLIRSDTEANGELDIDLHELQLKYLNLKQTSQ